MSGDGCCTSTAAFSIRYKLLSSGLVVFLAMVIVWIETSGGFETFYTLSIGALRSMSWLLAIFVLRLEAIHGLPR